LVVGLTAYNELLKITDSVLLAVVPSFLFIFTRVPVYAVLGKAYTKGFYDVFVQASKSQESEPPLLSPVEQVIGSVAAFAAIMFHLAKGMAVILDAITDAGSTRWVLTATVSATLSVAARSGIVHTTAMKMLKSNPKLRRALEPALCPGSLQRAALDAMLFSPVVFVGVCGAIATTRAIMLGDPKALVFADVSANATTAVLAQVGLLCLENICLGLLSAAKSVGFPEPEFLAADHPLRSYDRPELPFKHTMSSVALLFGILWLILMSLLGPNFVFGLCTQVNTAVPERWLALTYAPDC
jgi:hypothetical protein